MMKSRARAGYPHAYSAARQCARSSSRMAGKRVRRWTPVFGLPHSSRMPWESTSCTPHVLVHDGSPPECPDLLAACPEPRIAGSRSSRRAGRGSGLCGWSLRACLGGSPSTARGDSAQLATPSPCFRWLGASPVPPTRIERRLFTRGSVARLHPLVWITGTSCEAAAQLSAGERIFQA